MKIAVDGMLLRAPFSGVETSILNLARALAESGGEDVHFFVPGKFPESDLRSEHFTTRRSAVPGHLRPVRILWEQAVLPYLLSREHFDLLHAPGYVAPVAATVPVVITLYDLMALRSPQWCKPTNRLHYGMLLARSARKAAGIIVPSACTRHDVLEILAVDEEKVRVIPLGVGEEYRVVHDEAALDRVRRRYGLPRRFILFTGRNEPKKNLPGLVDALRLLKTQGQLPHQLVVVGDKGWRGGATERRIRQRGLAGDVRMVGFVPTADLVLLYNMADLFVFPSLYEGFGLPPLESMACGTAVVASNRGAVPEVVGDAALLIDPADVPALADAVSNVLGKESLKNALVQKGLARARLFSWKRAAEATEKFYRDVFRDGQTT